MLGGPPQQETFDLKPEVPGSQARSLFPTISTNVPGIEICGLLPELARQADRFAIIRSVFHGGNALFHGVRVYHNLTGFANVPREGEPFLDRRDYPSIWCGAESIARDTQRLARVSATAHVDHPGRTRSRMGRSKCGISRPQVRPACHGLWVFEAERQDFAQQSHPAAA